MNFADPVAGPRYGYTDRWDERGIFHYTGAGQTGDQQLRDANLQIANHARDGRAIRLFAGARGVVTYEGELELDLDDPYYSADALEAGDGAIRKVIVFRFRPVTAQPKSHGTCLVALRKTVERVAVEKCGQNASSWLRRARQH
jgi:hypothetical protein